MVFSFGLGKDGNGGSASGAKGGGSVGKAFNTAVVASKVAVGVAAAHNGTASSVKSLQNSYGDGVAATARSEIANRWKKK